MVELREPQVASAAQTFRWTPISLSTSPSTLSVSVTKRSSLPF